MEDAVIVSRDTSFYYSFLVLPAAERDAIVTVWDACRAIDDAVDEAPTDAAAASHLAFWREEIHRVFEGRTPVSPQGRALQPVAARYHLPRRSFEDLIDDEGHGFGVAELQALRLVLPRKLGRHIDGEPLHFGGCE